MSETRQRLVAEGLHGMQGKKHSEETLNKMREKKNDSNHPRGMLGKTHTEETRRKISEAQVLRHSKKEV